MAGVIRGFANGLVGPTQVPQGFLRIDWSHPLSNGLMFYYLPGVTPLDIANKDPGILALSGASFIGSSPEGPSVDCTINNSGDGILTSTVVPGAASATAMSVYARGYKVGAPPNNSSFIAGITFSVNPNNSPFVMVGLQYNLSTIAIRVSYNQAGSLVFLGFNNLLSGSSQQFSLGGSVVNGGNVKSYYNGALDNSAAAGVFTPSSGGAIIGGNDNMQHTVFCGWNRELTADEMMRIHLDPYGMLVPAEYDLPALRLLAATTKPYPPFNLRAA